MHYLRITDLRVHTNWNLFLCGQSAWRCPHLCHSNFATCWSASIIIQHLCCSQLNTCNTWSEKFTTLDVTSFAAKRDSANSFLKLTWQLLYAFFWVIPHRQNFICRRFGTLCCSIFVGGLWRGKRQRVPKRRHIQFGRRGITKKKAYDMQNTAKVEIKNMTFVLRLH